MQITRDSPEASDEYLELECGGMEPEQSETGMDPDQVSSSSSETEEDPQSTQDGHLEGEGGQESSEEEERGEGEEGGQESSEEDERGEGEEGREEEGRTSPIAIRVQGATPEPSPDRALELQYEVQATAQCIYNTAQSCT